MDSRRGIITVAIKDEEGNPRSLTFRFDLNCWDEFCRLRKIPLSEISNEVSKENPGVLGAMRDLLYCALVSDVRLKGKEPDFNNYTVGVWINDMDQADYNRITDTMQGSKLLGNEPGAKNQAPQLTEAE